MTRAARLVASCLPLLLLALLIGAGADGGFRIVSGSSAGHDVRHEAATRDSAAVIGAHDTRAMRPSPDGPVSPRPVMLLDARPSVSAHPDGSLLDEDVHASPGLMPAPAALAPVTVASARRAVRAPLVARPRPSLTIRS